MSSISSNHPALDQEGMEKGRTRTVTFRHSGNLLEVSPDGKSPLPEDLRRLFEPHLKYQHRKFLYGADRFDPVTGRKRRVEVTEKQLFRYDQAGRLVCGFGFLKRLVTLSREAGCYPRFIDKNTPGPRPNCYQHDLSRALQHFKFRDDAQRKCMEAILKYPCGVVHAITAFGKMVMIAMGCLALPNARIDVITRRVRLVNKLNTFLTRYIPNVGQVGDGKRSTGRVTVYSAASLHHSDFAADVIFADEAHELLADESAAYLARYSRSHNYAFTASPYGRLDGADLRMEALFGPTIFYISYQEGVQRGLVVPVRVEWSDVHIPRNPCAGLEDIPRLRWGVWQNEGRNQIIADKAKSFPEDDQVLVTVDKIEHAVHLRKYLKDYTLAYDHMDPQEKAAYIAQGLISEDEPKMTDRRKEWLREEFEAGRLKKAIATGVWHVGIDPQQLAVVVRADALCSETMDTQIPGRVTRTHSPSGKEVGIVCDFRDQFDGNFMQRAQRRYKDYRGMGWEQVLTTPSGLLTPME